jgi:hypothetical protein
MRGVEQQDVAAIADVETRGGDVAAAQGCDKGVTRGL